MPSSHLIFCCPFLLLPPIPPSIRVFSNESTLRMRWPKYWSFSFSIIPSKEIPGRSPSEWTGWISLQSKGLSRVFSNTTVQKHQFFGTQPSSQSNSHIHMHCVMTLYLSIAFSSCKRHIHVIIQCVLLDTPQKTKFKVFGKIKHFKAEYKLEICLCSLLGH